MPSVIPCLSSLETSCQCLSVRCDWWHGQWL